MNTTKPKIEMLKKHVSEAFGKKVYLLGTFQDGHNFWLEEPKWECGWYWGFGHVSTYQSHQHYDGLCFKKYEYYDHKKGCFQQGDYIHKLSDRPDVVACSLIEREQWILSDLMNIAYTLNATAELYREMYEGIASGHVIAEAGNRSTRGEVEIETTLRALLASKK